MRSRIGWFVLPLVATLTSRPGLAQSLRPLVASGPEQPVPGSLVTPAVVADVSVRTATKDEAWNAWRGADAVLKMKRDAFVSQLRIGRRNMDLVASAARGGDAVAQAVVLARGAQDPVLLARSLTALASDAEKLDTATAIARALASTAAGVDSADAIGTDVYFFAEGSIRAVATGSSDQAQNGTGAIGLEVATAKEQWNISINIAATRDTVSAGFGENTLLMGLGNKGIALLVDYRRRLWDKQSIHVTFASSRLIWSVKGTVGDPAVDSSVVDTTVVHPTTVFGVDVGISRSLFASPPGEDAVLLALEAGLSARSVSGWFHDTIAGGILTQAFGGDSHRNFYGAFVGTQITVGNVTALGRLSYFPWARAPGISDVQLTAGLSVSAAVFHKRF